MKKWIASLLILCLAFSMNVALAESVPRPIEDQLADIVKSALEQEELSYEYDSINKTFNLQFELDNTLGTVDVTIYLYDDMVSVSVDCPLRVKPEHFEKAAIFTTLANNEMYRSTCNALWIEQRYFSMKVGIYSDSKKRTACFVNRRESLMQNEVNEWGQYIERAKEMR